MCHIEASSSSPSNLRSRPTPSHINMCLGGTQRCPRPLLISGPPDAGGFGLWGESKSTLRRRVAELDALRSSFITSPGVFTSLSCLFSTVHSKKIKNKVGGHAVLPLKKKKKTSCVECSMYLLKLLHTFYFIYFFILICRQCVR